MRILVAAFAYNERKYIDQMVQYYHRQGCDIFILDNHSTDGTTEYLAENDIETWIMPTGGEFHLLKLQAGLVRYIRETKPDWVIYSGIDIYYSFDRLIKNTIKKADREGYNMIGVQHFNVYNTGEKPSTDFKNTYFYARRGNILYMIAKYQEPFGFEADSIQIKTRKVWHAPGILLNYGNCKPKEERMISYQRRKKAWKNGLDPNYGVHYKEGVNKDWIWKRKELIDLRKTKYYKYIKKL